MVKFMYYVYEFYIVDTGVIIYVGKGRGNRYKVRHSRNKLLTDTLKKYNCQSRIVKKFENEKEAFQFEYDYINYLKTKGQCSCNIHSGGAGGSGEYWTDELREEYSKNNVMKLPEQRKRMRENNPMSNPEIAEKTNGQKRKPVVIGNKEYASIKEAKKALNTTYESIVLWCKKGINARGEQCYFKGQRPVVFKDKRYNKGSCKPLTYLGKHYESPLDLAEELNISPTTIYCWLKRGFNSKGIPCRYDDDKRKLVFENRHVKRNKGRAKSVIINKVKYSSIEEASKKLKIKKGTLYSYVRGDRRNPKYICSYDTKN